MREFLRKILCWIYPELKWLKRSDYDFTQLRSWQDRVTMEEHVKIHPVHSLSEVEIGRYSYIGPNSQVSMTKIGRFCSIGPNLFCGYGIHPTNGLSTSPAFYSKGNQCDISFATSDKIAERKWITIGNDVFVGANVTILDGVTIGDGAIIGAGAVVSKDIPPYAIAVGSPIQIKRYRMTPSQINAMMRIQWWNWDEEKLKNVESMFFDIDEFIRIHDN